MTTNITLSNILGNNEIFDLFRNPNWWEKRFSYIEKLRKLENLMTEVIPETMISSTAIIEQNVMINGNVVICDDVMLKSGSYLQGPCFVSEGTSIGPNCFINGNVIVGPKSNIGQGAELKHAVLIHSVAMYHFSYIGHSIVGRNANIAAGVVTAVRRFDNAEISVSADGKNVNTQQKKFGAIIGDYAQIGVGVLICPGGVVLPGARIPPGKIVTQTFLRDRETENDI